MTMLLAAMLAQAAPPPPPTPEAEALGAEVARNGVLAIFLPVLAGKEVEEIIAQHPDLTAADKETLRATGRAEADAVLAKAVVTIGHQYALTMSIPDMQAVIAFNRSDAAKRWRAAEPGAIMAAAKALDGVDFKSAVAKDFCAKTGKLCPGSAKK